MIINNKRFVSTILLLATTAVSFATATANKKKPLAFSSVLARSLQGSGVSSMMWRLCCSWTIHHRRCAFYRIHIIYYIVLIDFLFFSVLFFSVYYRAAIREPSIARSTTNYRLDTMITAYRLIIVFRATSIWNGTVAKLTVMVL